MVSCTLNCGMKLIRKNLQFHLEKACKKRSVACTFKHLGCTWTGTVTELETVHLQEQNCQYQMLSPAFNALHIKLATQDAIIKELMDTVNTLQKEMKQMSIQRENDLEFCFKQGQAAAAAASMQAQVQPQQAVVGTPTFPSTPIQQQQQQQQVKIVQQQQQQQQQIKQQQSQQSQQAHAAQVKQARLKAAIRVINQSGPTGINLGTLSSQLNSLKFQTRGLRDDLVSCDLVLSVGVGNGNYIFYAK